MKTILFFLSAFILSAFTSTKNTERFVYEGIAIDLESQQVIYREVHNEIHDNSGHVVTQTNFFDASNKLIAKRNLDFSASKTKPQYALEDYRLGSIEKVQNRNSSFTITYKENKSTSEVTKTIVVPEPAVVDGGFNYFVKQQWNSLLAGNIVEFNYISVSRQNYYRFQLSKSEEFNLLKANEMIIKMEPSSYILRALLDPIYIKYDTNTKRIISYEGISNIKDDAGDPHIAVLTYPIVGP